MRTSLVTATTLVAVLVSAPAHADTWTGTDRAGDVDVTYHVADPPPCGSYGDFVAGADEEHDIVSLSVDHTVDSVQIELGMRDLTKRGSFYAEFHLRTPKHGYVVDLFPGADAEPYLSSEPRPPGSGQNSECGYYVITSIGIDCDRAVAEVDAAADVLRLSLPRSCLGNPSWVKVGARVQGGGRGYPGDFWGRLTPKTDRFVGPLGPRVHVGGA